MTRKKVYENTKVGDLGENVQQICTSREMARLERLFRMGGFSVVENGTDYTSWSKPNYFAIDVATDGSEVVLVDDNGDFASHHLDANVFHWLLGHIWLFENGYGRDK